MSQVLARKYRPRVFDQLIGQDHVAKALTNALVSDRLHHAYLFVGTRGVGKTSIARILARCLNCLSVDRPTATPCLSCSACQSIEAGRFVDLIEVDAASRTKVEDTRELLDDVQYGPSEGRFKVYLIDEVHMLSSHSFNALLKTLEEPPAHVKFLLATTNPEKVPVTILSRCLQFRLRDVPSDRISEHLQSVLTQESVNFELPGLEAISRAARGSIRDAMTLTDQAIAYSNGQVVADDVVSMLGINGQNDLPILVSAIGRGDADAALNWIEQVSQVDPDWSGLVQGLQRAMHDMALQAAMGQPTEMSAEVIHLNYSLASQGYQELPVAPEPRLGFEMTVLRMLAFRPAASGEYPDPKVEAATAAVTEPPAPSEPPSMPAVQEPKPVEPTTAPELEAAPATAPAPAPQPALNSAPASEPNQSQVAPPWAKDPKPASEVEPAPAPATASAPEMVAQPEPQPSLDGAVGTLSAESFTDALEASGIGGMALSTLRRGQVISIQDQTATLRLPPDCESLFMDHHRDDAMAALSASDMGHVRRLEILWEPVAGDTPNTVLEKRAAARLAHAKETFNGEPVVQWLADTFEAAVQDASIEPRSE